MTSPSSPNEGSGGVEPPRLSRPARPVELFVAFTQLALQGFGGVLGVAHRELVERRRWLSSEGFLHDVALAQALPGPNVCNLALMFGDRCFGWRGAAAALAGLLVVPTLILLLAVVAYTHWSGQMQIEAALRGMGAVAAGSIAGTALKLMKEIRGHPLGAAVALGAAGMTFVALALWRWPIMPVILGLGGATVLMTWWRLTRVQGAP